MGLLRWHQLSLTATSVLVVLLVPAQALLGHLKHMGWSKEVPSRVAHR